MNRLLSLFADDPDMTELVRGFVARMPARIEEMRAAAADPNGEELLRRLAHQLKGSAGGYGFPTITDAAGKVEDALKRGQREEALTDLDVLLGLCRQASAPAASSDG
jgi:HPt (histidine-containing phosphotransfer) domain-containing protein